MRAKGLATCLKNKALSLEVILVLFLSLAQATLKIFMAPPNSGQFPFQRLAADRNNYLTFKTEIVIANIFKLFLVVVVAR